MAHLLSRARRGAAPLSLTLALLLGACGGMPTNRLLDSVNQPVVERTSYVFDLDAESDGLDINERQRLDGWFDAVNLRYGDRVAVDDPSGSYATREAVAALAGRRGILLSAEAPVTASSGRPRVVVTRSTASVPSCNNWTEKSELNYNNATYPNYGCAINGNLAIMVANPEDLITGQRGTGETVVVTSTKAIDSYRGLKPTGEAGLTETSTTKGDD